jgi:hypothetical protein
MAQAQIPEIELSDPAVPGDPFTAYGSARERGPLARLVTPGFGAMWAVTRSCPPCRVPRALPSPALPRRGAARAVEPLRRAVSHPANV